ncbi:hypothetical protein GWK47_015202 [Chionoecetes opilio]|uniref:Dipeptidylpeptidase IV N-terminal domain-containing protein n=1 Tax=Chionoecetes opilio TaxID=41210 RepID=A0A8J5BZY2_CHIOP|nr:hypothetical protein GWK47_015202 [Chionoecetes opilio]
MEEKPGERHLFRTSDVTSPMMLMPDCLSCLEADNSTDTCLYNSAHFSTDFSYYVLECQGPDVPRAYLFSTWSNQLVNVDNYVTAGARGQRAAADTTFPRDFGGRRAVHLPRAAPASPGLRGDDSPPPLVLQK